MSKEMLFLCDVYTNWCDSQNLPNFYSADDYDMVETLKTN